MILQYVATIVIVVILMRLFLNLIKDRLSILTILFWIIFWLAGLVLIWSPNILDSIGDELGVGRGIDVVLYISIIMLFYIIINQNNKIRKLEKDLTKVVRAVAKHESE